VIVGALAVLAFGGDEPELSPQDQSTPTAEAVEVIFARGAPKGRAAIQKALVTGAVIQAGDQRRDGVQVDPGRYTVLVRSPDETTGPTDTVSLQVR
jgi:hypothetical protein